MKDKLNCIDSTVSDFSLVLTIQLEAVKTLLKWINIFFENSIVVWQNCPTFFGSLCGSQNHRNLNWQFKIFFRGTARTNWKKDKYFTGFFSFRIILLKIFFFEKGTNMRLNVLICINFSYFEIFALLFTGHWTNNRDYVTLKNIEITFLKPFFPKFTC